MEHVQNQRQRVIQLYTQQGWPINRICREENLTYTAVKSLLAEENIPVRGRGSYTLRGSSHPSAKLSSEELLELEVELASGCPHGELAERYGVSRERIRQIGKRLGTPTGRELQLLRRADKILVQSQRQQERELARRRRHDTRYEVWRQLWADGLLAKDIALQLGLKPGAVSVRIVNLRKRHPDWFPHRRKPRVR